MAQVPDTISQILATLAAQNPGATSTQQPSFFQHGSYIQPPSYPPPAAFPSPAQYSLPKPTSSGSIDLRNIKPASSGSVNLADAFANSRIPDARSNRGEVYHTNYRTPRSRSRSPVRPNRERYVDQRYSYRDERRDDVYRPPMLHGREESFSPDLRGPHSSANYSPLSGRRLPGPDSRQQTMHTAPDDAETIFVDAGRVGPVIGRHGENLRRIEADTGARVQFNTGSEAVGPNRQCKITGSKTARQNAKNEIYRIAESRENASVVPSGRAPPPPGRGLSAGSKAADMYQPPLRVGDINTQIMVPDRTVGLIIGRGGETIRDLQERSRCHVNIVGENRAVNGLRPVNLVGSPETTQKAKDLIMEIVETDAKNLANQGGISRDSVNATALGVRDRINDLINEKIFVPGETVGMIIGKGGETIRDIQSSTGSKINVTPPSGNETEREIEVVGTRVAIENARAAIMSKVRVVHEKNRTGSMVQRDAPSDNPQHPHQSPNQPQNQQILQAPVFPPEPPGGEAAYVAYGGYQNYVALWHAGIQANQAQQLQQKTNPSFQGPPGSS